MRKFAALLLVALVSSAAAATYKVPPAEPIATVGIPEKWQSKARGEIVEATAPDRTISIRVVPIERSKIGESMNEAMRFLRGRDGIVVQADSRKDESIKLNGMEARNFIWQGKDKKGEVKIKFTIVVLAPREKLLVASWGSPEANKNHATDLEAILQSIKKP